MKRLLLAALGALLGILLLAGCGGGNNGARSARKVATVTIKITIPADLASKLAARYGATAGKAVVSRARAGQAARLIPSNALSLRVTYDAIAANGNSLPAKNLDDSITPATAKTEVITDLAAGVPNTITATLFDGNLTAGAVTGNVIATGSTTVNIAPGATATTPVTSANAINITLQSTVTGTVTFVLDGVPVPASPTPVLAGTGAHTVTAIIRNSSNNVISTITPAGNIAWSTTTPATVSLTAPATGYTTTFNQASAGAGTINLTYSEPNSGNAGSQIVKTASFSVNFQNLASLGNTALPNATAIGSAFDAADTGFTLFYDAALTIAGIDANPGYSRVIAYNPVTSPFIDLLAFDSNAASATTPPHYTGSGSRLAIISSGTRAAIVEGTGANVTAFPITPPPVQNRAPTTAWTYIPSGLTIADIDAKVLGSNSYVYLLEHNAGGDQVEVRNQADGSAITPSAGSATTPPAIVTLSGLVSFTPTNLAVTSFTTAAGTTETDYYLSDNSTNLAKVAVVGTAAPTVTSFSGLSSIVDIAASADGRLIGVVSGSTLRLLSSSGSVLSTTPALAFPAKRLAFSGSLFTVLENNAGSAVVQSLQLQ